MKLAIFEYKVLQLLTNELYLFLKNKFNENCFLDHFLAIPEN